MSEVKIQTLRMPVKKYIPYLREQIEKDLEEIFDIVNLDKGEQRQYKDITQKIFGNIDQVLKNDDNNSERYFLKAKTLAQSLVKQLGPSLLKKAPEIGNDKTKVTILESTVALLSQHIKELFAVLTEYFQMRAQMKNMERLKASKLAKLETKMRKQFVFIAEIFWASSFGSAILFSLLLNAIWPIFLVALFIPVLTYVFYILTVGTITKRRKAIDDMIESIKEVIE